MNPYNPPESLPQGGPPSGKPPGKPLELPAQNIFISRDGSPLTPDDLRSVESQLIASVAALKIRIEKLESNTDLLTRSDDAQRRIITQLRDEKEKAVKETSYNKARAERFDKMLKVLVLSLVFSIFLFDGRISSNPSTNRLEFELKTKEVPLVLAGAYGLAVLVLVLDKHQIGTIVDAVKQVFLGRDNPPPP